MDVTAELVGALVQGGFCGVLLLVLWIQARERAADRVQRITADRDELTARLTHWTEETAVLRAIRDSMVRLEPLPTEVARVGRRLDKVAGHIEQVAQAMGVEITAVGETPRRRTSDT